MNNDFIVRYYHITNNWNARFNFKIWFTCTCF